MPKLISDETIRRRDVRAKLEWPEIKRLITDAAIKDCGIDGALGVNGVEAIVEIEQSTAGSPSYAVREWTAVVKVTLPVD